MKSTNTCPDCDEALDVIRLGSEPPREVCGRLGCDYDGRTVSVEQAKQLVA